MDFISVSERGLKCAQHRTMVRTKGNAREKRKNFCVPADRLYRKWIFVVGSVRWNRTKRPAEGITGQRG